VCMVGMSCRGTQECFKMDGIGVGGLDDRRSWFGLRF
jgi:hypothetical protein